MKIHWQILNLYAKLTTFYRQPPQKHNLRIGTNSNHFYLHTSRRVNHVESQCLELNPDFNPPHI